MFPSKSPVAAVFAAVVLASFGLGFQPEFAEPLENLTVAVGRDATFRCLVQHLGGYRVGWVKADTKAIQAIHDHVITHNPRVSVSHSDHSTWNLHVRSVQEEDRGQYMCQINTDPMQSQMGHLDVVVPPDFINEETSGDLMVPEGGTAKLTCKARGYPAPHVTWRREDNGEIVVKEAGAKTKLTSYQGEVLKLLKITRSEMGAYLCIASNGIPPSVSKRILLNVHFHPVIQVPNQLVGAPTGTDVTLECYVEASPKSINYWVRDSGEMVISSEKYEVQSVTKSLFEVKMILIIRSFHKQDVGSYRCIAKNSLGEVESSIRLYEIPGPTRKVYQGPPYDEEDQQYEVYGSAEEDQDELSNSVQVIGGWGQNPTSGSPSKGTLNTMHAVDSPAASSASRSSSPVNLVILFLGLPWIKRFFSSELQNCLVFRSTPIIWAFNLFETSKVMLKSTFISVVDHVSYASSLSILLRLYQHIFLKPCTIFSLSKFNRIYTSNNFDTKLKSLTITRHFRTRSVIVESFTSKAAYPFLIFYALTFSKLYTMSDFIFRSRKETLLYVKLL